MTKSSLVIFLTMMLSSSNKVCSFMSSKLNLFLHQTSINRIRRPFASNIDRWEPNLRNNKFLQQQQFNKVTLSSKYRTSLLVRYGSYSSKNESGNSNDNDSELNSEKIEPTWTYVPYTPPPSSKRKPKGYIGNKRRFSSDAWSVPNKVSIPLDEIDTSFVRSSGAGGQNVNKVNTQVMMRFHVMDAKWIPLEVRQRICQNDANKINKEGILTVNSQEYRTQAQNRKDALEKIEEIVMRNYPRPKVRKIRKGRSKKGKQRMLDEKKMRSLKKENRRNVDF